MRAHTQNLLTLFLVLLSFSTCLAGTAQLLSPDVQQSYAYGSATSSWLQWDESSQTMTAIINYSNTPYVQNPNNIQTDELTFKIPGVTFDSATGLYSIPGKGGAKIPFARRNPTSQLTRRVLPLDSTRIVLDNMGGTFMLYVNACDQGEFNNDGAPWVERTHGFRLGNLISGETAIP
ncbi:hypothetical protein QPK87_38190 [Kamptonema cortianum]|nr:hypothetical protein [Kamptonema cortianum]MDL5049746.1 hypothetical protein [Oscillatoria amoena NRMC-F 0135]